MGGPGILSALGGPDAPDVRGADGPVVGGPLVPPDDYVPRSRIVWTLGRRGSLLGVDQYGNGYRIERQSASKRRCGVVLSLFRVSTNMHVSVPARTSSAARRRATRLYGDVLGARHLSPDFGKRGR